MIKECKILFLNPFLNIVVVDFDGIHIQITGKVPGGAETVFVKYENGFATIIEKEDYEKSLKPKAFKKPKKVETIDEIVESEAVENETDEISE